MNIKHILLSLVLVSLSTQITFASIDQNLKYGQKNSYISELQEFLIDKGFLKSQSTGFFGLVTLKAVKAYQTSIGLPSTGYVGVLTREKINAELTLALQPSNQAEAQEVKQAPPQVITSQPSVVQQTTPVVTVQNTTSVQPTIVTPQSPSATDISIQSSICNLSLSNLKTTYTLDNLLANGNTDGRIVMNAYILDKNGNNFYSDNPSDVMTISTSDHSHDKTFNGSGTTGACGYYYPYEFYTVATGTYTVTYSFKGLQKSVTITVQ